MRNYLFFDVDRTLLDPYDHSVPASALEALHAAHARGDLVMLCTGRAPYSMDHLASPDIDGMIFCNGAGIILKGETVRKKLIPAEIVRDVIALAGRTNTGLLVQSERKGFVDAISRRRTDMILEQKKKISLQAYERTKILLDGDDVSTCDGQDIYKMDVYFEEGSDIEAFRAGIDPGMSFVCMLSTSGNRRNGGEITMPGVDKGEALRWLVGHLGGDMAQTYGFGDSLNDLSMLEACHTAVAMGNAEKEVLAAADYVTDDMYHDGIRNALKHFGLIG